jgi:hypothetical protein
MAKVRDNLAELVRLCGFPLLEEVLRKGQNMEALMMAAPATDPERWGYTEASVHAGRLPEGWMEDPRGETHPLFVLGSWDMVFRDALEHDEPAERLTVATAAEYIGRQLTYMATYPHVPFEDFATALHDCRAHMEQVLADGVQVDKGAPCMSCNAILERTWGETAVTDGWKCPRCHQTSTEAQYRFAVQHLHREAAEWLTDEEMEIRTGVKAGTVRQWSRDRNDGKVPIGKKREKGRTLYSTADVEARLGKPATAV